VPALILIGRVTWPRTFPVIVKSSGKRAAQEQQLSAAAWGSEVGLVIEGVDAGIIENGALGYLSAINPLPVNTDN